jgi:BMFP domain-containing protein YqiC
MNVTANAAAHMIDLSHIDDLARRLSNLVPPGMRESREELQQNFKSILQAGLGKLDLVTREEFDVQRAVLLRTREKLEALQQAVAQLEAQLQAETPAAAPTPSPNQH